MRLDRVLRPFAFMSLLAAAVPLSCGLSSVTAPDLMEADGVASAFGVKPGDPVCDAVRPQTEPDLMGWDSGSRSNLKALQEQGVVGVRYKAVGCNVELEVLQCVGKGVEYGFSPYSATESKTAKSQRDLFAELPIGAAKLGGKVGGGRALRTDYMLAGVLKTPVMKAFPSEKLEGDCDRATHVVSTVYMGGFAMASGQSETLAAEASIFGVGVGGSQDRTAERLASEGNPESCAKAQKEGTREALCNVPLRIGLTPIAGREEAAPVPPVATPTVTPVSTSTAKPQPSVNSGSCPAGMAAVPAGSFKLGGNGEEANVQPFCLDVTEVTVSAYAACVKTGACTSEGIQTQFWSDKDQGPGACNAGQSGRDNHPMNCVDWGMAMTFCKAQQKRLPTEAEWEWAARGGGDARKFPWGSADPEFQACWSGVSKRKGTCEVGSFAEGKGRFGHQDLAGNVWEWTSSKYQADKAGRVGRGGGWAYVGASGLSASYRRGDGPSNRNDGLGFRCAR
jgi:formylglycine-generating enzyme required for sulfatase activity